MALINCPECGTEVSDVAENCPKCGYPINKKVIVTPQKESNSGCSGCFKGILFSVLGFIILLFAVGTCDGGGSSTNTSTENYNDNSSYHQILAKNYFKNHLKKSMKDPSSYDEISYTSTYNYSRSCYVVDLKFRAKNSFGGYTIERWMCDVTFEGSTVKFSNQYRLE